MLSLCTFIKASPVQSAFEAAMAYTIKDVSSRSTEMISRLLAFLLLLATPLRAADPCRG
jgi:hypothetical protein